MATCPKCMGALTDNHRCPRGMLGRVTDVLATLAVGGASGAIVCFVIEERPVPALIVAAAALGAVLASGLRQAVGGRL
jgi:ABC-type xylose transport system permease subunit